jgi:hypothetical protein
MSIETRTAGERGTVHLAARVPSTLPDSERTALYDGQERAYLVELHKIGDVDEVGRVWRHHYRAVYATITGQRAVTVRVEQAECLPSTLPIHEKSGTLVPQAARDCFEDRIRSLHIDDGESR